MKNNNHFFDDSSEDPNERERRRRKLLLHECMFIVETYVRSHVRNSDDVSNLKQEALLRICDALWLSHYDEQGHFRSWALTITMNVVRDYYRKKQKAPIKVPVEEGLVALIVTEEFKKYRYLLLELCYEKEKKLVLELSPNDRSLIIDILREGMSFRQAAQKRGISKSACFKHYKRILAALRKKFMDEGIDLTSFDDNL